MSHVINPNALRLGNFSLTWSYSHKFSEISKIFKLHLELNYLLNHFLKIYGLSLLKYHISFEKSGLKLNLVVLRYIYNISNQKIFTYYKDDVRTINNPFLAVTKPNKFSGSLTDMKFLQLKKSNLKLGKLGLSFNIRRWDLTEYAWYLKIDSMSEQRWGHSIFKYGKSCSLMDVFMNFIKKKIAYLTYSRRFLSSYHMLNAFKIRRFLSEKWFDNYERFSRWEMNKFYFLGFRKKFYLNKFNRRKRFKWLISASKRLIRSKIRKLFINPYRWLTKKKKVSIRKSILSKSIKHFIKQRVANLINFYFVSLNIKFLTFFFFNNKNYFWNSILIFFNFFLLVKLKKIYLNKVKKLNNCFKFNKIHLVMPLFLKKSKDIFFNKFLLKKKYSIQNLNYFLKDRILLLSLSNLLLDKFNLVFFVNIYNGSNLFKNSDFMKDLFNNIGMVKRWSPQKGIKAFIYFYIVLFICIRLRITGPISNILSILLAKNVTHYKILFCFRNIMSNLETSSKYMKNWKGIVIDAVGRVNGSDRKKYCRYSSTRMFALSTFDTIVNQSNKRSITKYGLVNIKVLSFWSFI